MKCWICKRQARGYGFTDGRYTAADPRRYPMDWVFCSMRCQDAFAVLYGNWKDRRRQGVTMMAATDIERAARRACLQAFGTAAGHIGFEKPLGAYSEAEALAVIDAIVTRYSAAMVEHHEASKYPPVRGLKNPVGDPLADFDDDIPF